MPDTDAPDARPGGEAVVAARTEGRGGAGGGWMQIAVLLVMLLAWSLIGSTSVAVFLSAYVIALVVVNSGLAWFGLRELIDKLTSGQRVVLAVLLSTAPVVALVREALDAEPMTRLEEMREFARDKLSLEKTPAIFPALVRTSEPQRFFINAPAGNVVTVRFEAGAPELPAENLGHGLFMLDFDPRKTPLKTNDGPVLRTVIKVDGAASEREVRLVKPLPHPRWFTSAPQAGLAATVSEETDELVIVRRNGKSQRIAVDDGPSDCAIFDGGRRVVVCHRYSPALFVVDAKEGRVVERRDLSHAQTRLAVSPDEKLIAVALDGARRGVQFLSMPALEPCAFVPLKFAPDWIAFGRDAGEMIVTDRVGRRVFRLNSEAGGAAVQWALDDASLKLSRPVVTLCRGPGGATMMLAATANEPADEPITANHYIEDTILRLDVVKWEITQAYATHRNGLDQDAPGTTQNGVSPMGMAIIGDSLLIAFAGSDEIGWNSAETDSDLVFQSLDDHPLHAPHGVADLGGGVYCVSSPVDGTIGVFNPGDELKHLIRLAPAEEALEKEDPAALLRQRGERTFYETTRAGLSCQSCHLHADTDHCQHSIGAKELVDVLTVRGVAGTSPYLRGGPYPQLRNLHSVADEDYRGYLNDVDWDRAEALDRFMSSLPPKFNWRTLEPHDTRHLREGMDAFVDAQCANCHTPPAMTNLSQHPVKQLFPDYGAKIDRKFEIRTFLDVPTLRSISTTPPYLHNGRAPSLESIFLKHNPAHHHGDTTMLGDERFRALIDFLKQL